MGLLTLGFEETPSKFSSGVKVYAKEDNYLYMMTSTGVEVKLAKASESNQLLPSGDIGSIQINKDNLSFSSFGNWDGTSFDIGSGKFIGDGSELTGLDFVPYEGANRDVDLGNNQIRATQFISPQAFTGTPYPSFALTGTSLYLDKAIGETIVLSSNGSQSYLGLDFGGKSAILATDATQAYLGLNDGVNLSTYSSDGATINGNVLANEFYANDGVYNSLGDQTHKRNNVTKLTHATALTTIHQALDVQGDITGDSLTLDNNLTISSTIRAIDVDTNGNISIADMGNDNGYVRLDGMTEHNLIKSLTSDKSSYKNFAIRAKSTGGSSITGDFVVDTFGNTIMYGSATVAGTSKTNGVTNYGSRNTEPTSPTYTLVAGDKYYLSVGLIGWYTYSGTAWVRDRVVSDFLDLDVTAPVNHVVTAINTDEPFLFWDALGVDSAKNFTLDVATGVYTYTGPSGVKFDGRLSFSGTGSTTNMVSELSIYVDTGSGFTRLTDSIYPVTYDSGAPSSGIQMTTAILNNGYKIKVMLRCTKTGTITFGYIKKQVRQV